MLDLAITHQSDPFPFPHSTGPKWIRRPREALAKDPSSTPPRAAVGIEDADTVDGEVATERIVPVPEGCPIVYRRWIWYTIVSSWKCSWVTRTSTSCTVGILQPSRDFDSIVACFDQRTRCSGESPSTTA